MQERPSKPLFSKTTIIGLFTAICLLLTIPLTLLVSQGRKDIRGKAAEPTKALTPTAQGEGYISGYVYHDGILLINSVWYHHFLSRIRQRLYEKITHVIPLSNTSPWIPALALGIRNQISQENWQIFIFG